MTKRNRKTFTKEQKLWAVEQYISGALSAEEIATQLDTETQYIYRWKVAHEEKLKGIRLVEISESFTPAETNKRVTELEQEVEEYKKKLAEQVLMVDLLKKLQNLPPSQRESELAGLIRTSRLSALKKGPVK